MTSSIQLSDKFNYKRLLRYTLPSIIMVVFTSLYSVVDGFFVSNFAGKIPFAAVNFIAPFLWILGSVGFMFGTGSGALIAKTMGEGQKEKANQYFSLIIYLSIVVGVVLSVLGMIFIRPLAEVMGGEGELLDDSLIYGRIILLALPAYVLQYEFQCLFSTAEKPKLGLFVTALAGITNIVLDALFIVVFKWGIIGAAVATAIGQIVGGMYSIIYFAKDNSSPLRLVKCPFDFKAILKTCTNGSSELMSNVAMSLVSLIYNVQLLKYAGEDGLAAYGVLMYISMIFQAIFFGYTMGVAPIISYKYGEEKHDEVKDLLLKNICLIASFSFGMFMLSTIFTKIISNIFVGYDKGLVEMTIHAFRIFNFSFLMCGFTIMISSFFTALNDGLTSVIISFLRALVFQMLTIIILPLIWQLEGIWWALVVSEALSLIAAFIILLVRRKRHNY